MATTPKKSHHKKFYSASTPSQLQWGDYAQTLIRKYYQQVKQQPPHVLSDRDPEPLHQMRVGLRRLRVVLQTFGEQLDLPVRAENRNLRQLGRKLGKLRDLDVQTATLKQNYRPLLPKTERRALDQLLKKLHKRRAKAFRNVKKLLAARSYAQFKATYKKLLKHPQAVDTPVSQLASSALVNQLERLLQHPGWHVSPETSLETSQLEQLHDLRKVIKKTRYQAEFFAPIHSQDFCCWLQELKALQDNLGRLQDSTVLATWLDRYDRTAQTLPTLRQQFSQNQQQALQDWEVLRQPYLDPMRRDRLRLLVIIPTPRMINSPAP